MIIRELLIRFGAQLDKNDINKADQQVRNFANNSRNILSTMLGMGFVYAFKRGVSEMVTAASAVRENLNVLSYSFGENMADIEAWAQAFGDAAGRSKYEMAQMAGQLGAVLNPMLDKNTEAAAEMSKGLSELAVDLASFFNTADEQAGRALLSGIVGETEPLKRYGIIMTQEALKMYMKEKGIKGNIATMSQAEKTQLRYNFILEKTTSAQGDAIRTAHEYANASRALRSKVSELAVDAGAKLLPIMGAMVQIGRRVVTAILEISRESRILESALLTLAVVAGVVATAIARPWLPLILAIKAVIFAVDDFWTFLEGGESVIGDLIEWIAGPGSAADALEWLKTAFQTVTDFIKGVFSPAVSGIEGGLSPGSEAALKFGEVFRSVFDLISKQVSSVWNGYLKPFIGWFSSTALPAIVKFADKAWPKIQYFAQEVGKIIASVWEGVLKPAFSLFTEHFLPTIISFVETAFPPLLDAVGRLTSVFGFLWENILSPLVNFLIKSVLPVFFEIAGFLADVMGTVLQETVGFFADLYDGVMWVVDGIIEFIDNLIKVKNIATDLLGLDKEERTKKGTRRDRNNVSSGADSGNEPNRPINSVNVDSGTEPKRTEVPAFKVYNLPGQVSNQSTTNSNQVYNFDQKVEVSMSGEISRSAAKRVVDSVTDAVTKENRAALAALSQRGR